MIRMGTVWDRTVEVLNGRVGLIAPVAILAMFLPSVVRDGYVAYSMPGTIALGLVGGLLSLVAAVLMIWAHLTIIGIASDPAATREQAGAAAGRRILPAIGVTLALGVVATILVLPPMIALAQSGFDFHAAANGGAVVPPAPGIALFVALYGLAFGILAIWVGARLVLLNLVILHERLGLGAVRRSFALTRGLTWRIIGVIVLFVIVLLVAAGAAQAVVGVIFRLVLGSGATATATYLGGIAASAVSTALTVLAAVFTAQLYVAARGDVSVPAAG